MVRVQWLRGHQIAENPDLLMEVLKLDKLNMEPVLKASGFSEFPTQKRIARLKDGSTHFCGVFNGTELKGYLEICRDWKDPQDIYLTSIQIHPSLHGTAIFRDLIKALYLQLRDERFNWLLSNVQVANERMLNIFKTLGFEVCEGAHPGTKLIRGDPSRIYDTALFKRLIK